MIVNSLGRTCRQRCWTELAIECYKSKFNCKNCYYNTALESSNCRMKATVLELIRVFGLPPIILYKEKVIDKILE